MKKWSEDDEIYLEYYLYDGEEKSYDNAAKFLNKSNGVISEKARRMRKIDKNVSYIQKPFTEKEVDFIKNNYEIMTSDLIAERLGRTRGSIITKAHEMGVTKRKRISHFDSEIRKLAAEGYYRSEIARKLKLNVVSVHQYINRHGIDCEYAPKEVFQEHAKKWRMNF